MVASMAMQVQATPWDAKAGAQFVGQTAGHERRGVDALQRRIAHRHHRELRRRNPRTQHPPIDPPSQRPRMFTDRTEPAEYIVGRKSAARSASV